MTDQKVFHGHARRHCHTPTYSTWCNMRRRCYEITNNRYYRYGARGITVCPRWRSSFSAFLSDMGEKPLGLSLDRINSDKNYTLKNCRWASRIEQAKTRKNTLDFAGKSLRQKCLELGIAYKAAHFRLKHGHDPLVPIRRSKYNAN